MDFEYILIYWFLVVGAVALFLLMPRAGKAVMPRVGLMAAVLSVVGVMVGIVLRSRGLLGGDYVWFVLLSSVAVSSAFLMIIQSKALYSALFFVLTLLATAALILLQQAEFIAVALVIVYAGAVMVVYVFVLMLSQKEDVEWYDAKARTPFLAVVIGFVLISTVLQLLLAGLPDQIPPTLATDITGTGSALNLGTLIFDRHMIPLQVAGVILLVAAVGGIALIKHGGQLAEKD